MGRNIFKAALRMRIRRKKHLAERIESVGDYFIKADYDKPNVKEAIKDKKLISFSLLFKNDNPVEMEIGCGKGGFIAEMAATNPDCNYIAVELLENILVMAAENAAAKSLTNVKFFNCGAAYLPRYIPQNSLEKIYLNFSPPFPHKRYENRRLTCDALITDYCNFLKDCGEIIQKTDDEEFFQYSFSQFKKFGFNVENISGKTAEIGLCKTEYERKFIASGIKIFALVAKKSTRLAGE